MSKNKKKKSSETGHLIADNRKARFNYAVEDDFEAGIVLTGTEVKSLRQNTANIAESYAEVKDGEVWLVNSYIAEFSHGNRYNHEPRRLRKLLLNRREINKLQAGVDKQGMTLVPLRLYFNAKGIAKMKLGLAKGKKAHDKRQDEKARDWSRQKSRLMKDLG